MEGRIRRYGMTTTVPPNFFVIGINRPLLSSLHILELRAVDYAVIGACQRRRLGIVGAAVNIECVIGGVRTGYHILNIQEAFLQAGIGIQHGSQFTLYRIQHIDCCLNLRIGRCIRTAGRLVHIGKVEICLCKQVYIVSCINKLNILIDQSCQCSYNGCSVYLSYISRIGSIVEQICRNAGIGSHLYNIGYQAFCGVPVVVAVPRRNSLADQIVIVAVSQSLIHIAFTGFQLIPPNTGGHNAMYFIGNFHIIDTNRYRDLHIAAIDIQGSKAGISTGGCILNVQVHPNTLVVACCNRVYTVGNGSILGNQCIRIYTVRSRFTGSGMVQIIAVLFVQPSGV